MERISFDALVRIGHQNITKQELLLCDIQRKNIPFAAGCSIKKIYFSILFSAKK